MYMKANSNKMLRTIFGALVITSLIIPSGISAQRTDNPTTSNTFCTRFSQARNRVEVGLRDKADDLKSRHLERKSELKLRHDQRKEKLQVKRDEITSRLRDGLSRLGESLNAEQK